MLGGCTSAPTRYPINTLARVSSDAMTQRPQPFKTPLSRSAEGLWNEPCPKNAAVQDDVAPEPDQAEHKAPNTDTPVAADETTYKTWSIPFAPGEYHHFEVAALDPVLAYLRGAAPKTMLRVEGFSYSRGTLATQVLADKRAKRVLDALVAAGVERQSMDYQGVYANNVTSASPYSGARVHISHSAQAPTIEPRADTSGRDQAAVTGGAGDTGAAMLTVAGEPAVTEPVVAKKPAPPTRCVVRPGLLADNLTRLSQDFDAKPVIWSAPFDVPIELGAEIPAQDFEQCVDRIVRSVQASQVAISATSKVNAIVIEAR